MDYDIIIIGTGAGGGTLACKLAPSGKKILLIERGGYIPREQDNWSTQAVFIDAKYTARENWLDKDGKVFQPGIHYCVGGNTKFYGAALLRMRERDFTEVKHYDGISPAWPIQYADLAPYYTEAERLYSVHGLRGSDPTEPPETAPYAHEPLPHEPRIQELFDDMQKMGLHPFPLPMGVRNGESETAVAPLTIGHFDGYPDPTECKADAHVVGVRSALRHENVTLWTDSFVEKLETDSSGRKISKVILSRNGEHLEVSADIVVVSCGAINSAALLLRSASDKHPNGLANSSDMVGRHYMAHNNSALLAVSKRPNPTRFGKTLALNDFYWGDDEFPYPMGHIQMLGKSDALALKEGAPSFAPELALDMVAKHSMDFWMTTEDLPDPENRVTLTGDGNIQIHYRENNLEAHHRLGKKLEWILEHTDCEPSLIPNNIYLDKKIPIAGTAHQSGTARFGTDPKTSVLNTWCRAHEVDNLYVVDGSFFPSCSAVNPSLTIIAMALRVGDYLMKQA